MRLSNSGRIVLIDDTFDEALPLMQTFNRNAIPYMYFDGGLNSLPVSPQDGIRFVFLDIELRDTRGLNEKLKASALTARLKKIIAINNGPYVIVFWTKHSEIIEQVLANCKRADISPVAWIDLEKTACKNDDGTYDIEQISDKLKLKLEPIGAFNLYIEWENTLHNSSKKFVSDLLGLVPQGDDWSNNTSKLFYKLFKSYANENKTKDPLLQFKFACFLMNRSYLDTLQNYTTDNIQLPHGFKLVDGEINSTILAKLNSSLFIINCLHEDPTTGYIYLEQNKRKQSLLTDNIFKKGKCPTKTKLCNIILTPECDIANNKALQVINTTNPPTHEVFHRIMSGIIYNIGDASLKDEKKKFEEKGGESRFLIGPLWYNNKPCLIVMHFASISYISENKLSGKPIFGLRRDLMFDLQSKAANHVNRLGNFQLS